MIKWFALAGLMAVMFYIGMSVERHYKQRATLFKEFFEFLQYAAREIGFLKTDIVTLIERYTKNKAGEKRKESDLAGILKKVGEDISTDREIKVESALLKEPEKELVSSFFRDIMKSGFKEQEKVFARYSGESAERVKTAEKQKKEKGELTKKLCILAGVGLLIVLI